MNFHSILAITNLSPQGNRAVLRAAMPAAQRRALLKIIYAPSDLGASINTDVEQDGRSDVARRALTQQQHSNADLIVVGKRKSSGFSDYLFRNAADRVLRLSSR